MNNDRGLRKPTPHGQDLPGDAVRDVGADGVRRAPHGGLVWPGALGDYGHTL